MQIYLAGASGHGFKWSFFGSQSNGMFRCNHTIPVSIAWHLSGTRFGDVVEMQDVEGEFLASATIVSADVYGGGSLFELAFPDPDQ